MESKYIDLTINRLTQAQYDELKNTNQVSEEELYIIIDHDDLFYYKTEVYNKEEVEQLLQEIRNSITSSEEFAELQNSISAVNSRVDETNNEIASLDQRVVDANNKANTAANQVSTLNTNFQNYQTTVSKNYLKIEDANNTFATKGSIDNDVAALNTRIGNEESNRKAEVAALRSETTLSDTNLASAIAAEETNRKTADNSLSSRIASVEALVKDVSSPMDFIGVIDTDPATITSGYQNGDVVIYGTREFVWSNGSFVELGDSVLGDSVIASTVIANTPLSGGEEQLTSISIDDTTYSVFGNTLSLSSEKVSGGYTLKSMTINGDSWNIPTSTGTGTGGDVDLSDYYTKSEIDNMDFGGKVTIRDWGV